MPVIDERLDTQPANRYAFPDDGMPRSRRPGAPSIRPGSIPRGITIPPPPRVAFGAEFADQAERASRELSRMGDSADVVVTSAWPFDVDESAASLPKATGRQTRVPSEASEKFADGVQDVLARLRPSESSALRAAATAGEAEAALNSWGEPHAGVNRATSEPSRRARDESPLARDDDDAFNPFTRRELDAAPAAVSEPRAQSSGDDEQRTFGVDSFRSKDDEAISSGVAAMFASESARDPEWNRGSSDRSGGESAAPTTHAFSELPSDERISEIPRSREAMPSGASSESLDAAIGDILGSSYPASIADGTANLTAHLDALLEDAARTADANPEVDFGNLDEEFQRGGPTTKPASPASDFGPPAKTLRGRDVDDNDFFGDDAERPFAIDAEPSSWGETSSRAASSAPPGRGPTPNDDVFDVDPRDVSSLPPTAGLRWPDEGDDDFDQEPKRQRSSYSPESQEPQPSAPPDDEDDDRASEWGSVDSQAGSLARSIPNYNAALEKLTKPPSAAPSESRRPLHTSLPPKVSSRPASRIASRGIWLATALVVAGVAVTLLPWYMLTRAEKHAQNCFHKLVKTTEGDPAECVPSTSELALPRSLPWLKADALRIREQSEFRAARLAYDIATAIVPNATRRDEAALRLLELTYRGSATERAAALGVVAGAHAAVTQFAMSNREPEAVSFALRSSRAIGDLDGMRSLATGSSEDDPFGMSLRRGALLCLLGDPEEGARAFVAADLAQQRQEMRQTGHGLARLGLIACGKPKGVDGEINARRMEDRLLPAMAALDASFDTPDGFAKARSFLEDGKLKIGGIQRLRIAPYVLRETKQTALEALRLMAPLHAPAARSDLAAVRTPWMMFDVEAPVQAVYIDTRAAEIAAPYLENLAEKLSGKPLDCSGEECPDPAALKLPDAVLKEAARMVWFEAAAEHARLGHREAAIEAANHATELAARTRRYLVAPILLAVGDAEGALNLLVDAVANLDGYTPLAQTRVHLNHALALAHLGRYEPAMAAAERAYVAAGRAEELAREGREGIDTEVALQDDKIAAAWLWGAMALLVGKPDSVGEALRDATTKELAEVATWVGLATRPEEERRAERWELALAMPSQPALPAVMYVVSRAVPSMTEVEVWIDRVFQQENRTQPIRSMLARAEAARWRNDAEAERNWQSRAAKMLGLIKDYKTSLLAHFLELH